MNWLTHFYDTHPTWFGFIFSWITNTGWTAFVSSLRSPTAESSQFYVSLFAILNKTTGNFSRGSNTSLESSPNFVPVVRRIQAAQIEAVNTGAANQLASDKEANKGGTR